MKKRLLKWMTTFVVVISMVLGGSVTASAASVTGELYWSWSVPMTEDDYGFGYGISSPAAKSDYIYVVSYDKLYKIQYTSGEVAGVTELGGNVQYNRNAPTIAGNNVIVPLADSKLAVVNYNTMELLKVVTYAEGESGYQSNTQAVYDSADNAVYLGSWGGSKLGTYVKVDIDDYSVTKIVDGKGFYFAGAAINGDYVVFGSEASGDDTTGNATLYAWNKTTGKLISTELTGSGAVRSTVVAHNGAYYFTARSGGFYKAVIDNTTDPENPTISAEQITDLGAVSVCSPIIATESEVDYAYVGYQVSSGWDSLGGVKKINLMSETEEVNTITETIPAGVSDLHQVESPINDDNGKGNIYATYNGTPGGIWDVTNNKAYFVPDSEMQQYCMSSISQHQKRFFYTNDSGCLMAVENTDSSKTKYRVVVKSDEGGIVSPSVSTIASGSAETLYIVPDDGYKIASVKVDGVKQEAPELYNYVGTVKFNTEKLTKNITVEVEFAKIGKPVTAEVDMNIQQSDRFDMAHEKLTVSSDMAESYGYKDKLVGDKVSALDALVAAHVKRYGDTQEAVNAKLIMQSDGTMPQTMMGVDKSGVTTNNSATTGFTVNGETQWENDATMATANSAEVKTGDCIDFFWYETNYGGGDIFTAFVDDADKKVCSKTVNEGQNFDVFLKGFSVANAMYGQEYDELATKITYSYYPEGSWKATEAEFATGETELFVLKKNADGTYSKDGKLTDADKKEIATDADAAKATLKLAKGQYYITADKDVYVDSTFCAKSVMPFLEVAVLCNQHTSEGAKCAVCGFEKENIEGKAVSGINAEYVYTGSQIKPTVTIAGLKEGTDFTVSYTNNINIGTATVTIKGIGNYTGTITKTFAILKPLPKEGAVVKDTKNTAKYEVTESERDGVEVAYAAPVNKKKTTVTIPATVTLADGTVAKVTSIDAKAFKNNKKIKKVTIGKNVETIGKEAFSGATKLTTVTIGSKVKKIGNKAFYKATALKKVTVPAKTTTIGSSAFYRCKKLTTATIGKNVKSIGSKAFYGTKNLKKITIKSTKLTSSKVGKQAFKGVPAKAKVDVPNKKVKAYKKFFYKKGLNKKAKIS